MVPLMALPACTLRPALSNSMVRRQAVVAGVCVLQVLSAVVWGLLDKCWAVRCVVELTRTTAPAFVVRCLA